jgi:Undecaprenyl-phosphate galactose phosphotransferase WbaP
MTLDTKNKPLAFHQFWNSFWLLLVDCLILLGALYAGDLIVYHLHGVPVSLRYSLLLLPAWCAASVVTGQIPGWGLGGIEELRRIELLLFALFAFAGIAAFLIRGLPSRIVFLSSYVSSALLIPFGRVLCRKLLGRLKRWGCPVALYGDRERIERILDILNAESAIGYNPCGVFSDDIQETNIRGVPVLGKLNHVTDQAAVAMVSIANLREHELVVFIDHTLASYRKVVLLPNIGAGIFSWVVPRDFNGMVGFEISRNLLVPLAAWFKRVYEILLVVLLLPVWFPLVLLLAGVVFFGDRNNPFYAQQRVGRNGRLFKAIKLRTMVPAADETLRQVLENDDGLQQEWNTFYKLKNDPRITRVGNVLRRFSLDELPQLFNVLAGDMALIGPRPLPVYHDKELTEESRLLRNRVRPGMTGQWQVSGRSDCSLSEMEQWDSFYVRNWSLWMDLYIMARTLRVVFFSHGAY